VQIGNGATDADLATIRRIDGVLFEAVQGRS